MKKSTKSFMALGVAALIIGGGISANAASLYSAIDAYNNFGSRHAYYHVYYSTTQLNSNNSFFQNKTNGKFEYTFYETVSNGQYFYETPSLAGKYGVVNTYYGQFVNYRYELSSDTVQK